MPASYSSLIPGNDEDRLQVLNRYRIIGTAPERLFNSLTSLTAKLFNAPIALVSLVEQDTVWFKANFGLPDAKRVARNESICSVAILQDEPTLFENLRTRPCMLIDPRVIEELQLSFYTGHPLQTTDGFNIGALCVIDRQPRSFSPDEAALLRQLAATVMLLLELRSSTITSTSATALALPDWDLSFASIQHLVQRLLLLAEIGSTGAAVDAYGNPVPTHAIHQEAGQVATLLNQTITAALAA